MPTKRIYCPIHGFITLTDVMRQIIDTPEFQRLRNIKQLAAVSYVFPSANHTRFEHSIGVSHLAGIMMNELYLKQPVLVNQYNAVCISVYQCVPCVYLEPKLIVFCLFSPVISVKTSNITGGKICYFNMEVQL